VERLAQRAALFEGQRAGEQQVENRTERVDVRTTIDVADLRVELLRAHKTGGAKEMPHARQRRRLRRIRRTRLREPKVYDARHRLSVHLDDQHVCRFKIAVDDGFLVCVLHAFARLNEKLDSGIYAQSPLIAVSGDWLSWNVLHDEVGLTLGRGAGIKDLGDGRMVHDGE